MGLRYWRAPSLVPPAAKAQESQGVSNTASNANAAILKSLKIGHKT
jgi:hypothetical protein